MSLAKNFVFVAEVGQGKWGSVRFHLPVGEVDEFSNQNSDPSPSSPGFDKLKKSLVAVKVALKRKNDNIIEEEIEALQSVERVTNDNPDVHFPKLRHKEKFQLERDPDEASFLVLEAITPPVTLEYMLRTDANAPIPLVYHLFLSLGSAVRFLRNEVGLAHQDIKQDNILVRQGPSDLPQFVLIDFGNARAIKDSDYNKDCRTMLQVVCLLAKEVWEQRWEGSGGFETVGKMADRGEQRQDQVDWTGFREMLDGETESSRTFTQVDEAFEDIWNRWKGVAQKARDGRTEDEMADIKRICGKAEERAAEKFREVRDEDLIDAVKRHEEGKEVQG
ncbi:hypothetical protein E8E13_011347 [Curvularia kusanoi]|uniref:Autophagy-related protein 1 n=1 Tax=Curvularia kusanoi TaxID=90978 RepID=A0A9P4TMS1_CURKU|nr:hypothetical protein E8E13_011347 [Curvularia kusanoi]